MNFLSSAPALDTTFHCDCGQKLRCDSKLAGQQGTCPTCCGLVAIPASTDSQTNGNVGTSHPNGTAPAQTDAPSLLEALWGSLPVAAPLAVSAGGTLPAQFQSRYQMLSEAQVVPDASRCVQCGICSHNCPMGIDVRGHARRGRAIHDSHCLTCSECVNRCPRGVLRFEQLALFTGEGGP